MSELKQHLYAVEQTRQITNAMYLLSTSNMKKSMQNIGYNLMYLQRLRATMKDILSKTKRSLRTSPYIELKEGGKEAVSAAAMLLFGRNPKRFFPRARIRFVRYEGELFVRIKIILTK